MSERQSNRDELPSNDRVPDNRTTSRRSVLRGVSAFGAAGVLGAAGIANVSAQVSQPAQSSPDLEKWIDELPRPSVLEPEGKRKGTPYYEVEMCEVEQQLHSQLPATTVWGYEGQFPGPTIEAKKGEPVCVRWENKLPEEHLLPVDETIHGAEDTPEVRTVTHLHGGNVEPESDGHPDAWFTRDFQEVGPYFEKENYHYVNNQPATTLWYHDHALGITRLNVYAGLAGFYLLRDKHEDRLRLPRGEYEIPIVLQDRTFNSDGSLFYPDGSGLEDPENNNPDPSIVPEFFGDTPVINGAAWPRLTVEPRKYRFRLLDGSNSRFYNLKLFEYDEQAETTGGDGPPFVQIGSDGGFLEHPVQIGDRLLLGPGERADVIVDFSDFEGETLLLHNNAPSPFRGTVDGADDQPLPEIMLIDVGRKERCKRDRSCIPKELARVPEIPRDSADRSRQLPLAEGTDDFDRLKLLLGTQDDPLGLDWDAPITEDPQLGDTEIWNLVNLTEDTHPIHLHLVQFQILGRRPFDVAAYLEDAQNENAAVGELEQYYTGSLQPPASNEEGWNDVVSANPGEVTQVIAHFGEYEGLFNDFTGEYPWHCHILEHEDHEMMRPYEVKNGDGNGDPGETNTN